MRVAGGQVPHELCEVAARHRRGWHLLATHAEGLLECEGLPESPLFPQELIISCPQGSSGICCPESGLGQPGQPGFSEGCALLPEQAAGNCRCSAPLKALPKGAQVPWEVSHCWVPVLGGDSPENTQGIQELQGCGRIQAGRLL